MIRNEDETSVFVEYFGDSPFVSVLDFLIEGEDFDYSLTEVARGAGVGWSVFTKIWEKLLEKQMILPTRNIGNAKLFRLNKENPAVKKLIKLDMELTKIETEKISVEKFSV